MRKKNAPQLVRDTISMPALEVLFPNRPDFNPDSLPYVPYANGAKFELRTGTIETASGIPVEVFEAKRRIPSFWVISTKNFKSKNLRMH